MEESSEFWDRLTVTVNLSNRRQRGYNISQIQLIRLNRFNLEQKTFFYRLKGSVSFPKCRFGYQCQFTYLT